MTHFEGVYLDKLQVASVRLAATVFGFFAGDQPVHTIDNSRAVSEIITDLRNHLVRIKFISPDYKTSLSGSDKGVKKKRGLSNFAKHADKDPQAIAFVEHALAVDMLDSALIDHLEFTSQLARFSIPFCYEDAKIDSPYGRHAKLDVLGSLFQEWMRDCQVDSIGVDMNALAGITSNELQQDLSIKRKYFKRVLDGNYYPVPHHGGYVLDPNTFDFETRYFGPASSGPSGP